MSEPDEHFDPPSDRRLRDAKRAQRITQKKRALAIKENADSERWKNAVAAAGSGASNAYIRSILGLPPLGAPGAPGKMVMRRLRRLLDVEAAYGG